MQELMAALVSLILVQPLQREVANTLAAAQAPRDVAAAVANCAREHGPDIVNRAIGDPWWAASSALSVWTGLAQPSALLAEAAPSCAAAIELAEPFLNREAYPKE